LPFDGEFGLGRRVEMKRVFNRASKGVMEVVEMDVWRKIQVDN